MKKPDSKTILIAVAALLLALLAARLETENVREARIIAAERSK